MKTVLVVVNPCAGGGRAGAVWERVRVAGETLATLRVVTAATREEACEAVQRGLREGCERVVAFGGDGTSHLVAGAMLAAGSQATLGIVPAGTGSDLARALGVPRDPAAALRRAVLGPPRPIDAVWVRGEAASFHYINIASAGISGLVDEAVNAMPGRGRTAFLRATLAAVRRYRPIAVEIELDGVPWFSGPVLLAAFANGTTFGKGMRIAPGALLDDGLLDVVVVGDVTGLALVRRLPRVYLGRHIGIPEVKHARAREVRLRPLAAMPPLDVDGETYPCSESVVTVLPGALRIAGDAG